MKRFLSVLLAISLLLSALPASASDTSFPDLEGHWAKDVMLKANADGLLFGANGMMEPDGKLTRAHIAAIVTRAFGATVEADMSDCTDVPADSWYAKPIAQAVGMGIMANSDIINPNEEISRLETFLVLAAALNLNDGNRAALDNFSDKSEISESAIGPMSAMAERGYVRGANGKLNPNSTITRAEFAALFSQIFTLIHTSGTLSTTITGNVLVNSNNAVLNYCSINGDLIIGDSVDTVSMVGVSVTGDILVRGGKERVDMGYSTTATGKIISFNRHNPAKLVNSSSIAMKQLDVHYSTETTGNFTNVDVINSVELKINSGVIQKLNCNAQSIKINNSGIIYYAYANANNIAFNGTGFNGIVLGTGVTGITLNSNPLLSTIISNSIPGLNINSGGSYTGGSYTGSSSSGSSSSSNNSSNSSSNSDSNNNSNNSSNNDFIPGENEGPLA